MQPLVVVWMMVAVVVAAGGGGDGGGGGGGGNYNPLVGLPALPKPHFASNAAIGSKDLANPGLMALWGEFARIAHSLPISLMAWGGDAGTMKAVIALASQHNASINGQYSPWYSPTIQPGCKVICSSCGPRPPDMCDPTITANDTQELDFLRYRLGNLTALAAAHDGPNPVKVSMVFLDGERFVYNQSSSQQWKDALTHKHNLIYDTIKSLAPDATVVQYGRCGTGRTVPDDIPIPNFKPSYPLSPSGWPTPFWSGYYTGDEKGDVASTDLYALHQLGHTRVKFNATVTLALAHGIDSVVPTLCLGCGYEQQFEGHSFTFNHNYSQHFSWTWGTELNDPKYGADPERFASYDHARMITLFPGPFGMIETKSYPASKGGQPSPELGVGNVGLDHFVSYVLGSAGIRRLR